MGQNGFKLHSPPRLDAQLAHAEAGDRGVALQVVYLKGKL
jgi:hypothetical protein